MKDVFPSNTSFNYNWGRLILFRACNFDLWWKWVTFTLIGFNNMGNCSRRHQNTWLSVWVWNYDEIMETSKMPLQSLWNLHFTNWLRVVDVIFIFLFLSFTAWSTETLLGFLAERFSVGGQFSEISGQFNQGYSWKLSPCWCFCISYKVIVSFFKIFYLVYVSLVIGYFYCMFIVYLEIFIDGYL